MQLSAIIAIARKQTITRVTANVVWKWFKQVSKNIGALPFAYPTVQNSWYENCCVIVDGTDLPIVAPSSSFEENKRWFSYKLRGPALRYVVGISLLNDQVCFCYGPRPAATVEITMLRDSGIVCLTFAP